MLNIAWTIIDLLLVFGGNPFKKSVSRFNRLYKLHSPLLMDSWNRPRWSIIFSDNRCWSNSDQNSPGETKKKIKYYLLRKQMLIKLWSNSPAEAKKKSVNIIWVADGRRAVWKKIRREIRKFLKMKCFTSFSLSLFS